MIKMDEMKKMDEIMMIENEKVEDCEIWYDDLNGRDIESVKNWVRENLGDFRRMDVSFIEECVIVSNLRYRGEDDEFIKRMIDEGDKIEGEILIKMDDEDLGEMSSIGIIEYIENRFGRRVWDLKIEWMGYDGDVIVKDVVLGGGRFRNR